MTISETLAALVAAGLLVYLVAVLLRPERF
ncbi:MULTISPECIES: K(+)-transporting ATPase subunit F [Novosphingobium]|uniref:K(+)-transporting ATPase subunit F n=1 Tax=Novosphingobium pokkalii TaxID=1770194 RepID=A0ABV7V1E5_9SPHN|nr:MULTISPECIES: K(+)-transporting ATPase subunit F [Novosphingobium]NKJ42070.1 K+-transporting ATPase KdpF subunit [Novosphingobium sp. SG720]NMN04459.1 K+-transporting ATPase KdpF subunit [Novosphingobium sp. SG919]NMN85549.1 K+-transporting ATPase KdpF subunit [Novosphingobium sp. SG916]